VYVPCDSWYLHNVFYLRHHQSDMSVIASSVIGLYVHTLLVQVLPGNSDVFKRQFTGHFGRSVNPAGKASTVGTVEAILL
jgi:hypothetical protein